MRTPPPRSAPSAIRTPLSLHTPPRLTGAASPVTTPVGAVLRHPHTQRLSVWLASALPSQDTHATPPHQQEEYISESQEAPERVPPHLHRYGSRTLRETSRDDIDYDSSASKQEEREQRRVGDVFHSLDHTHPPLPLRTHASDIRTHQRWPPPLTLRSLPHSCHPRLLSSLHPPIPALPSGISPHPNVHLSSDFRDVSLFLPPTPDMKSERRRHQSLSLHPIRPPPLRRSHRRALSPPTPTRLRWR